MGGHIRTDQAELTSLSSAKGPSLAIRLGGIFQPAQSLQSRGQPSGVALLLRAHRACRGAVRVLCEARGGQPVTNNVIGHSVAERGRELHVSPLPAIPHVSCSSGQHSPGVNRPERGRHAARKRFARVASPRSPCRLT